MMRRPFPRVSIPLLITSILVFQPLLLGSPIKPTILSPQVSEPKERNTYLAPAVYMDDRFSDIAVGVYLEDINSNYDCGAAHVFYGREIFPYTYNISDSWSQSSSSIHDYPEDDDRFGFALAGGDFNGDSYQDLAIGVPLEDLVLGGDTEIDAGAVHLLYGTYNGLSDADNSFLYQEFYGDRSESHEYFGYALASGDFNGDRFDDLAIGSPGEEVDGLTAAGMVTVVYGSASGLTTDSKIQELHQNLVGIADGAQEQDQFGIALATGDFNADQYDDLVVGIPYEDVSGEDQGSNMVDAGAVNILYGSSPDGLSASGAQFLHQNSPNVDDSAEPKDHFGWSLATGRLNRDQYDDLAIGVPQETFGDIPQAGAVSVLFGFSPGIVTLADQFWHQDIPGLLGDGHEDYDRFGWSLAAGDFDMNGFDDLAIGVPMEDIEEKDDAGVVHVLYSKGTGPNYADNQLWHHDLPSVTGNPAESQDSFGYALETGDLNGDSYDELLIGVPGKQRDGKQGAGFVNILPGGDTRLTGYWDAFLEQPDLACCSWTAPGEDDHFGSSLAVLTAPFPRAVFLPIMFNEITSVGD